MSRFNSNCFSEKNISILHFQGKRLACDSSENFWKRKLLYDDNSIKRISLESLSKLSQVESGQGQAKYTNAEHKWTIEDINKETLMNFNGPVIMGDFDNVNDQTSANYIRVKRSETNNSIIHHQWNHSMNLIDSRANLCNKNDTISAFGESTSKLEGSYIDSNYKDGLDVTKRSIRIYSRRKRGVLSKNGRRRKRIKGNIARRRKTKIDSKKHDTISKSSHKPGTRKGSSLGLCVS